MGIFKIYAPINVKPQGEGVGHGVGILTFSFKIIQIPHPWDKIIKCNDIILCFVQVTTLERDIQRYKSNKKRELKIIAGTRRSKSSSYRKY